MKVSAEKAIEIREKLRIRKRVDQKNFEFALNYEPKDNDRILVTYPKSGTSWTQQIMRLILNDGNLDESDKFYIDYSFIDFHGRTALEVSPMKTHLRFDFMPFNKSAKYFCVFRNPKDVCVSYYFHELSRNYLTDKDFHSYFKDFMKGNVQFGDYFDHTLQLWSHRNDANFQYLVYEQMKANTRDAVLKIASFLGEESVTRIMDNNEEILDRILENSTLSRVRGNMDPEFHFIFRKGVVGDWRNHLTKQESDLVDMKVNQVFGGTGLDLLWADCMKYNVETRHI